MSDTEIENVLRDIRALLRAETHALQQTPASTLAASSDASTAMLRAELGAALTRLQAHLQTTEQAWNRLPPLTTKRRGLLARLELWFKRTLKRATHFYTFEQVSFNAATNNALREIFAALSLWIDLTLRLHDAAQVSAQSNPDPAFERAAHDQQLRHLETSVAALTDTIARIQIEAADNARAPQLSEAQLDELLQARFNHLRDEQRAIFANLLDEQRVSDKQLALQINEQRTTAAHHERFMRARLERLELELEALRAKLHDLEQSRRAANASGD